MEMDGLVMVVDIITTPLSMVVDGMYHLVILTIRGIHMERRSDPLSLGMIQ